MTHTTTHTPAKTAAAVAMHLSLACDDIAQSVAFYGRLFGQAPAKHHADYAKFEVAEPPLVLSLVPSKAGPGARETRLSHAGLRYAEPGAFEAAARRVRSAGLSGREERDAVCCYARQDKLWVTDPDGNQWELYHLIEDTPQRDDSAPPACCA